MHNDNDFILSMQNHLRNNYYTQFPDEVCGGVEYCMI